MKLREIIKAFRHDIKDEKAPYLVPREQAVRLANEAESEAARRARLLVDSTTEGVARYSVEVGDSLVELSPSVISFRRARMASSGRPLRRCKSSDMDWQLPGWDTTSSKGQPFIVVPDYQTGALLLYPPSKSADTLLLTVTREPINPMVEDDDSPEIPSRCHEGLIEWMKYRVFSKEDTDLYDPKQAAIALAAFEGEFGKANGIINEQFDLENYDNDGER